MRFVLDVTAMFVVVLRQQRKSGKRRREAHTTCPKGQMWGRGARLEERRGGGREGLSQPSKKKDDSSIKLFVFGGNSNCFLFTLCVSPDSFKKRFSCLHFAFPLCFDSEILIWNNEERTLLYSGTVAVILTVIGPYKYCTSTSRSTA